MTWRRINQLLLDLYACPSGRGQWPTVLDHVCRTLRVRSAVVQILVRDGRHTRSRWMVRDSRSEAARALHDRYFSDDVNPRMMTKRGNPWQHGNAIVRDRDFFDADDPLYQDLQQRLSAVEFGHFISVRLPFSEDESLALVLHRDFRDPEDFNRAEEQFALELMPHLRQAVQLATTLHGATQHVHDLHETVNSIRFALVLCNADATVCWMNRAAEHILAQRDGLWVSSERLTAGSTQETSLLRQAIFKAAHEHGKQAQAELFLILGRAGERALQVKLQRIDDSLDGHAMAEHASPGGRVLVMLSDPSETPELPTDLLRRLFALSPAEARLAAALCRGSTLNEYAFEHDISVGTARYQLKQIMAKTHVTRQSQLIQRLYSSVIAQTRN